MLSLLPNAVYSSITYWLGIIFTLFLIIFNFDSYIVDDTSIVEKFITNCDFKCRKYCTENAAPSYVPRCDMAETDIINFYNPLSCHQELLFQNNTDYLENWVSLDTYVDVEFRNSSCPPIANVCDGGPWLSQPRSLCTLTCPLSYSVDIHFIIDDEIVVESRDLGLDRNLWNIFHHYYTPGNLTECKVKRDRNSIKKIYLLSDNVHHEIVSHYMIQVSLWFAWSLAFLGTSYITFRFVKRERLGYHQIS